MVLGFNFRWCCLINVARVKKPSTRPELKNLKHQGLDNSGNEDSPMKRSSSALDNKDLTSPKKKRPKPIDINLINAPKDGQ